MMRNLLTADLDTFFCLDELARSIRYNGREITVVWEALTHGLRPDAGYDPGPTGLIFSSVRLAARTEDVGDVRPGARIVIGRHAADPPEDDRLWIVHEAVSGDGVTLIEIYRERD